MIVVEPYRRTPSAPVMGVLTPDCRVLSEDGWIVDLDDWPSTHRAWCSYDTARLLILSGEGEAICWNNEEIKWRHRRFEDGWKNRASDVNVIKLPWDDYQPETVLRSLCSWRDWLVGYGASPTGTAGSAAWSLLRATIGRDLVTSRPAAFVPPLVQVIGGRQELGLGGQGVYTGYLEQVDLPAAYASELGQIPYGGQWQQESVLRAAGFGEHEPAWWAEANRAVFVRARVRIPDLPFGPLPRRPRGADDPLLRLGLGTSYPTNCVMQGFWTWQELAVAEQHGCKILKVIEVWAHLAERRPFLPWWDAIQQGRAMPGLAGVLAKITGNAMWGRLCMTAGGKRTIRGVAHRNGLVSRPLPLRSPPAALDLAETISGRVRAKLVDRMLTRPELVVSGHTDGLWLYEDRSNGQFGGMFSESEAAARRKLSTYGRDLTDESINHEWRRKKAASRLEILTPQVLRFWPRPIGDGGPETVFAGEPAVTAPAAFDAAWARWEAEQ